MVVAGKEGGVDVGLVGDGLAEAVSGERHGGFSSVLLLSDSIEGGLRLEGSNSSLRKKVHRCCQGGSTEHDTASYR